MEAIDVPTATVATGSQESPDADSLRSLLRGELSAVEAYELVIDRENLSPEAQDLRKILADHKQAADYLRQQLQYHGQAKDETSGAWGLAVEAFVSVMKLFGKASALKALKKGEEYGVEAYEELLQQEGTPLEIHQYVRDVLVPHQKRHIDILNTLAA